MPTSLTLFEALLSIAIAATDDAFYLPKTSSSSETSLISTTNTTKSKRFLLLLTLLDPFWSVKAPI